MGVSSSLAGLPPAAVTAARGFVGGPRRLRTLRQRSPASPIASTTNRPLDVTTTLGPAGRCSSVYRDSRCPARRRPRLSARRRGALGPRPVRSPPRLGPGPLLLDGSRVHHSGAHPTLSPACQLRILTPPEHTRSTRGATRRGGITKRTAPGCPPRECGIENVFLPPHKSIPDESCVYRALETCPSPKFRPRSSR